MSMRQFIRSSAACRVLAVGVSSIGFGYYLSHEDNDDSKTCVTNSVAATTEKVVFSLQPLYHSFTKFLEPPTTSMDSQRPSINEQPGLEASTIETKKYDFIIIGNGNAGQGALRTLKDRCPKAKIAVIDPLRTTNISNRIEHYRETVTGFDPQKRTVQLLSKPNTRLHYKYGILVATGARGAPPPLELFEDSALSRVLELRTTELLGNTKRPMMAPDRVRSTVVQVAANGGKIAVLGSGWEALDLVCAAEQAGRKKPTIVFGNPGPAWNILPQYLSSELRKKMIRREIDILDRSVVRYVADMKNTKTRKLELHTAKVHDLLETRRTILDLLVVAPDSFGTKGTAALPTTEIPERMKESTDGRPWYKTWSQLTKSSTLEPSVVACFEDDGRVAVNAELSVAARIYAAGSVAKYPNSGTGQASIAGEGSLNGTEAGRVAAVNMSREYLARTSTFVNYEEEAESFATSSLPVWRSDVTSFAGQGAPVVSSLSSLGIQALCVGNCDSERLATRGFWWTNSSAQRKFARLLEEEEEKMIGLPENEQQLSRYRTLRHRTSRRRKRTTFVQPIYGVGVVFYLDSNGRIRGVMTWGLPFADEEGGTLNPHLLKAIEYSVLTNAGVSALDAEENHQIMNTAMAMQSQKFVELAVRDQYSDSTVQSHGLDGPIAAFSTPLYRYTEVGPANTATLKVLKRKEGRGLGLLGEDLYARDEMAMEQIHLADKADVVPANIPVTNYPVTVVPFQVEEAYGKKAASLASLEELNRYLAVQRGWEDNENRARPGKEDPLWLRPGDEKRNVSGRQILIDAYRSIMFPHRT